MLGCRPLATLRERGVIGRFEINIDQKQNRPQEALRLAQRQVENEPRSQGCLNRTIREPSLGTSLRGWTEYGGAGQMHSDAIRYCHYHPLGPYPALIGSSCRVADI